MQCPNDGATLVMSERQGVEIDYCPQCRGVWLDRGELDKIIERGGQSAEPVRQTQPEKYDKPYRKHKRESFLSDLFDS